MSGKGKAAVKEESAKVDDTTKRRYRAWLSDECPSHSVVVCGLEFARETEPPVIDPKTGKPRPGKRAWQVGRIVELTDAEYKHIEDVLARPVVWKGNKLISGKVFMGTRIPVGPLGTNAYLSPVNEIGDGPDPRLSEMAKIKDDIVWLLDELDKVEPGSEDEKAYTTELRAKRDRLATMKSEAQPKE